MPRKDPTRKVKRPEKTYTQIMFEGAKREIIAVEKLLAQEYLVSIPVVDNRYDLLAEKYPNYYRIQVKSLNKHYEKNPDYNTSVDSWIIHAYTNPKGVKKTYSKEDVDYIMGIDLENGFFAIVPIEEVPNSGNITFSEQTRTWKYFNSYLAFEYS